MSPLHFAPSRDWLTPDVDLLISDVNFDTILPSDPQAQAIKWLKTKEEGNREGVAIITSHKQGTGSHHHMQ